MAYKCQVKSLGMPLLCGCASYLRAPFRGELLGSRVAALATKRSGRFIFFWGGLEIFNCAGRNIDHALCPLVQVARAFGMLFGHDAIMEQLVPCFQGEIRPPYSDWPTTHSFDSPKEYAIQATPQAREFGRPGAVAPKAPQGFKSPQIRLVGVECRHATLGTY